MKYKFLMTLLVLSISSITFQFLYLSYGFNGGGYAMAPFVLIPIILVVDFLIAVINFLVLPKALNFKYNIGLFLGIITCSFMYDDGLAFFSNLWNNEISDGYANRLMYLPIVFGSLFAVIYENRAKFLN